MNPDWLPDLVLFNAYGNDWNRYVVILYSYFHADFIADKPRFQGIPLALKRYPLEQGKEATFWHMISEGTEEANRTPDIRRCERIRWPKPIIEHSIEPDVKVWENERRGETRICIWYEPLEYLIVLARRYNKEQDKAYILFWTAYLVTQEHQKVKYRREYQEWVNKRLMPPP